MNVSGTPRVGFIGLGDMGAPIAQCILRAGYALSVYDVREEAVLPLLEAGAERGTSPADVAKRSDSIGICVVNDVQLRDVFFGPEGLAPLLDATKSVFVTSSVEPDAVRSIAAEVEHTGAAIVDAPVSGSRPAAAAGTLTVLVGGSPADVERVDPVLRAFGKEIYHLGPVGAGQSMKIANNVMLHMNHLIVLEALRFARSQGLDEAAVIRGGQRLDGELLGHPDLGDPRRHDGGPPPGRYRRDLHHDVEGDVERGPAGPHLHGRHAAHGARNPALQAVLRRARGRRGPGSLSQAVITTRPSRYRR